MTPSSLREHVLASRKVTILSTAARFDKTENLPLTIRSLCHRRQLTSIAVIGIIVEYYYIKLKCYRN